eukprot:2447930-Alexandrium_andersonii.AAC.1
MRPPRSSPARRCASRSRRFAAAAWRASQSTSDFWPRGNGVRERRSEAADSSHARGSESRAAAEAFVAAASARAPAWESESAGHTDGGRQAATGAAGA